MREIQLTETPVNVSGLMVTSVVGSATRHLRVASRASVATCVPQRSWLPTYPRHACICQRAPLQWALVD